jgi:F-type H+-transporting ATPase subunit alpha
LDPAAKAQLERGYRLTELLKQNQHEPLSASEQVVIIYAGVKGYLDDVKIEDISKFERSLKLYLQSSAKNILDHIDSTGTLPDEKLIVDAIKEVKNNFDTTKTQGTGEAFDQKVGAA